MPRTASFFARGLLDSSVRRGSTWWPSVETRTSCCSRCAVMPLTLRSSISGLPPTRDAQRHATSSSRCRPRQARHRGQRDVDPPRQRSPQEPGSWLIRFASRRLSFQHQRRYEDSPLRLTADSPLAGLTVTSLRRVDQPLEKRSSLDRDTIRRLDPFTYSPVVFGWCSDVLSEQPANQP